MNALPTQPGSKVIERTSLRILLDTLPSQWIFRHVSTDDYGIDAEIELVSTTGDITGHFFKAQVKSSQSPSIRKSDGIPTVGGVKQTTLYYWTRLNKYIHVVCFLVDTASRLVYWTPVFWQAAGLIDSDAQTKTVEFLPDPIEKQSTILTFIQYIISPVETRQLESVKGVLSRIGKYVDLYDWCNYADYGSLVNESAFRMFLFDVGQLCFDQTVKSKISVSFEYYRIRSDKEYGDSVANFIAKEPVNYYFQPLLERTFGIIDSIKQHSYFWIDFDKELWDTAANLQKPPSFKPEEVLQWRQKNPQFDE
jgi:hypothetical protein